MFVRFPISFIGLIALFGSASGAKADSIAPYSLMGRLESERDLRTELKAHWKPAATLSEAEKDDLIDYLRTLYSP